ncbi:MAG TPA: NAD-dependent protein deacetylase [Propionibacteriaceae bacterium]|nr:NAD-dependent protein deacetylase [Propionibacteriaceae bacterium]
MSLASPAAVAAAAELLCDRTWVALTGAGMSTDSGIPDYRGPTSVRATPMQYGEFVGSSDAQRRYWARSYQGWRRIGRAQPNAGHHALADLEAAGLAGVITQNVDGLHAAAGSRHVINLHGDIATVVCLECGDRSARRELQRRLSWANPQVEELQRLDHAELRPDGDAVARDWQQFRLVGCLQCGGRLKPDVVFFGEAVPRDRVDAAYRLVEGAEVLVVLGSSLTVMSGLRFVRHQAKCQQPVVIINRGPTRGDDLATLRIDNGCTETLGELRATLLDSPLDRPVAHSK